MNSVIFNVHNLLRSDVKMSIFLHVDLSAWSQILQKIDSGDVVQEVIDKVWEELYYV